MNDTATLLFRQTVIKLLVAILNNSIAIRSRHRDACECNRCDNWIRDLSIQESIINKAEENWS
jgi:hypothetical protein